MDRSCPRHLSFGNNRIQSLCSIDLDCRPAVNKQKRLHVNDTWTNEARRNKGKKWNKARDALHCDWHVFGYKLSEEESSIYRICCLTNVVHTARYNRALSTGIGEPIQAN
jgi:hypothetical protein